MVLESKDCRARKLNVGCSARYVSASNCDDDDGDDDDGDDDGYDDHGDVCNFLMEQNLRFSTRV
jgi:hypothetical protein